MARGRPATPTEVAEVRRLMALGWGLRRVAAAVGRSPDVVDRIRRLDRQPLTGQGEALALYAAALTEVARGLGGLGDETTAAGLASLAEIACALADSTAAAARRAAAQADAPSRRPGAARGTSGIKAEARRGTGKRARQRARVAARRARDAECDRLLGIGGE